ncbi:MAG: prepilin-type N-terminal cleavage/methylation domain-containing protein [Defluviitaleaceae bacterium]|nr:prepilin-type N-terminal cleavage/methylation domain-containing protein [Defluviitaleaceae bacterium]
MSNLRKGNGGFTLVELVIVIVVIAILVAALTPAIMGVVNRANRSADESDARAVKLAASVAATFQTPPGVTVGEFPADSIRDAFGVDRWVAGNPAGMPGGDTGIHQGTYEVFFNGPMAIGVRITAGGRTSNPEVVVGTVDEGTHVMTIIINENRRVAGNATVALI